MVVKAVVGGLCLIAVLFGLLVWQAVRRELREQRIARRVRAEAQSQEIPFQHWMAGDW